MKIGLPLNLCKSAMEIAARRPQWRCKSAQWIAARRPQWRCKSAMEIAARRPQWRCKYRRIYFIKEIQVA